MLLIIPMLLLGKKFIPTMLLGQYSRLHGVEGKLRCLLPLSFSSVSIMDSKATLSSVARSSPYSHTMVCCIYVLEGKTVLLSFAWQLGPTWSSTQTQCI